MKELFDILSMCREKGIYFIFDDASGNLRMKGEIGMLNKDELAAVKTYKEEIVELLRQSGNRQQHPGDGQQHPGNRHNAPGSRHNTPDDRNSPIRPVSARPPYPLSSAQQRVWVISRFQGGGPAYHITLANIFEGSLHTGHLQRAFDSLIDRHEILRTVFRQDEAGVIQQYVLPAATRNFSIEKFDCRDDASGEAGVHKRMQRTRGLPFDLERGPLLKACLYRLSDNRWVFDLVIHHIIADGWSMDILIRDLMLFYNIHNGAIKDPPAPLRFQYKDFSCWQQQQLEEDTLAKHRAYWLRQFEGVLPVLSMPGDRARPAIKTYNGGTIGKVIDAASATALRALVRRQGSTPFMGLLSLVKALLYRYTGQTDIIIGSPVAGRETAGLDEQIGLYMNTLALRTRFHGTDSYCQLLEKVSRVLLDAHAHQAYPFDILVNELKGQRDMSRNALFDVLVTLQNKEVSYAGQQQDLADLRILEFKGPGTGYGKFDLSFNFLEQGESIAVMIGYNCDIFQATTISRLGDHLEQLLTALLKDPDCPISALDYLSAAETHQLLVTFNDTGADYPKEETVVDIFRQQVLLSPEAIALVFETTKISYQTLDKKTNRLANYLLANYTIGPDILVAVILDRSADMITAILGILKSGAAYVPIDPELPPARIEYILKDSAARIVLTSTRYLPGLSAYKGEVLAIDGDLFVGRGPAIGEDPFIDRDLAIDRASFVERPPAIDRDLAIDRASFVERPPAIGSDQATPAQDTASPFVSISPADLAYVIYTSGSTGHPKGVMISHGALVDYFYGILARTNIRDCRHFGMLSTISADLGNTVLYPSLLTGATLHIFSGAALLDPEGIDMGKMDCIKIVPSHWKSLSAANKDFLPRKCLIFGGEQLTPDILDRISQANGHCQVYNHYGPSETTIGKLITQLDPGHPPSPIPLGSPFCDSSFYILDDTQRLTPMGVIGEIGISGAGLARGYLNNPLLTAEKFSPFKKGQRIYRTGDLGRWLPDGRIEFIGRKDDQVKIRGYRVELGEIEAALRDHKDVKASMVLARTNANGEKELVAYLVAGAPLEASGLRVYLARILPSYMIPAYFIQLAEWPLTLNGKIDRSLLPDPDGSALAAATPYVAPRNETESRLVSIWQDVLGNKEIGIKDNFFELGGHSLKMMQLITRINRSFSVRLNILSIFKEPMIESISEQIFFFHDQDRLKKNGRNLKQLEI